MKTNFKSTQSIKIPNVSIVGVAAKAAASTIFFNLKN